MKRLTIVNTLALLALSACGGGDTLASSHDGGLDREVRDGSIDTGGADAGDDVADAAIDAHPGIDSCTDCILLSCPTEMSACFADPGCEVAWASYEQCRQQGGTGNCLFNFLQSGFGSDVLSCGGKHCSGKSPCP